MTAPARTPRRYDLAACVPACAAVLSLAGLGGFLLTILESPVLSSAFFSDPLRRSLIETLGGSPPDAMGDAAVPLSSIAALAIAGGLACFVLSLFDRPPSQGRGRARRALVRLAIAWAPATLWLVSYYTAILAGVNSALAFLVESVDLTAATCLGLTLFVLIPRGRVLAKSDATGHSRMARVTLIIAMCAYVLVFTAMNWGLWFNLRIPHGDSAMYEEHLWNLEHGKGFRSYLDQGLFLGEHLQAIHLLLIPFHLLFPSHLTLELAQSVVLALGAWPVFRLAKRHSGNDWAAALLGIAYLAYVPLHFLDISIDVKTFRPNALAIPTLLAALDALELRRYRWGMFWLLLTLSAQEDYAIPLALIGLWLVLSQRPLWPREAEARRQAVFGLGLFLVSILYLGLALTVVIPWFRSGASVHTASYFSKFGQSPQEIVTALLTNPGLVLATVFNPGSILYTLRLLLPVAFLPLRSPGRLLVAAPLFLLLFMNDLAMQTPAPVHHFHAALIPILFWAAAAGLNTQKTLPKTVQPSQNAA